MWSSGRSESALIAELPVPIEIRPIRGARRLRLRFDEARGILKLTCPVRTSRRSALAWALDQREWIETQLARSLPGEPFVPGATIPIDGRDLRLVWAEGEPRTPRLAPGELRCGGPHSGFE
ncbi:MAG: metal-dependent hydrolase, partial [Sphingomicrobium sp.]